MLLTCEKCQTVWQLEDRHLALGGRVVRCTACGNTWFEKQVAVPGLTPQEEEDGPAHFGALLAEQMTDDTASRAVTPLPGGAEMPAYDYRPAGLGPGQFGAMVFLLLFFVTVSAVFLLKGPVVRHYPVMTALYEAVGVDLRAPGEGLSLSALAAREEGGLIVLSGKVSNIAQEEAAYPAFRVTLRGEDGVFLKDWSVFSQPDYIAPGETIPLELTFKDVPEGGRTVEIRVIGG